MTPNVTKFYSNWNFHSWWECKKKNEQHFEKLAVSYKVIHVKGDFNYFHLTLVCIFQLTKFFPAYSLTQAKDLGQGGGSILWWEPKLAPQAIMAAMMPARPWVTDSKTMINLTFTAHMDVLTYLCPTFSLLKPFQDLGSSLWDVGLLSFQYWPHKINYFHVSPPLICLPLDLVSTEEQNLSVWHLQGQMLLHPLGARYPHYDAVIPLSADLLWSGILFVALSSFRLWGINTPWLEL